MKLQVLHKNTESAKDCVNRYMYISNTSQCVHMRGKCIQAMHLHVLLALGPSSVSFFTLIYMQNVGIGLTANILYVDILALHSIVHVLYFCDSP